MSERQRKKRSPAAVVAGPLTRMSQLAASFWYPLPARRCRDDRQTLVPIEEEQARMNKRRYTVVLMALLAILGVGVISPGPANATHAEGFISGFGDPTNDWADEGNLNSSNHHKKSIATGLWQAVLYADGYLTASDVDCDYGPRTTAATRSWQSDHGVGVDGSAGPITMGRADDQLRIYETQSDGTTTLVYDGRARDIYFIRISPNDSSLAGAYRVPYVEDSWQWPAYYHYYIGDC